MTDEEILKALQDAYSILSKASGETSVLPGMKPWTFVQHAKSHIAKQVDEMIAEVFA